MPLIGVDTMPVSVDGACFWNRKLIAVEAAAFPIATCLERSGGTVCRPSTSQTKHFANQPVCFSHSLLVLISTIDVSKTFPLADVMSARFYSGRRWCHCLVLLQLFLAK